MKLNSIVLAVTILLILPGISLQAQTNTSTSTNTERPRTPSDVSPADLAAIQSHLTKEEFAEFQSWVAIGPGGLPHTLEGYRSLQGLNKKLRNPLDISQLTPKMGKTGDIVALPGLPKRSGERALIAPFAIPHRQLNQHNNDSIREKQKAMFKEVVGHNKTLVHFQKSYFEKHNDAVFLNDSAKGNQTVVSTTHGEVGHMHPSDGSMHFSLSPSDTKEVLEKGWGELHGLAGQVYKGNDALPPTYMMVYAPRTEQELAVVKQILQAAIRYSSLNTSLPADSK